MTQLYWGTLGMQDMYIYIYTRFVPTSLRLYERSPLGPFISCWEHVGNLLLRDVPIDLRFASSDFIETPGTAPKLSNPNRTAAWWGWGVVVHATEYVEMYVYRKCVFFFSSYRYNIDIITFVVTYAPCLGVLMHAAPCPHGFQKCEGKPCIWALYLG